MALATTLTPAYYGNKGDLIITPSFTDGCFLYNAGYLLITTADLTFGYDAVCKVVKSTDKLEIDPNFKSCEISSNRIYVRADATVTTAFYVLVQNAEFPSTAWALKRMSGRLYVANGLVQQLSSDSTNSNYVPELTAAVKAMKVILNKENYRDEDNAKFVFTIQNRGIKFGSTEQIRVNFPSYYPGHLGENIACYVAQNEKFEQLYCSVIADWKLGVYGPTFNQIDKADPYDLVVYGIKNYQPIETRNIFLGFLTGATTWTAITEYRIVQDVRSNVIMADVELVQVSQIALDSTVTKTEAILKFQLKTVKQDALQDSVNFFFGTTVRV